MRKLHVLNRKEDLDPRRVPEKSIVVLDVIFATSTIITTLANGACEVVPVIGAPAARTAAGHYPPDRCVLAGESNAERIEGFAPFSPLALLRSGVRNKSVVYCTTNGTVALRSAEAANAVYAGALLNGEAVARAILADGSRRTVLMLCSGSRGRFNLEDFYAAGYIVDLLTSAGSESWVVSDSALAARAVFRSQPPEQCLLESRVGQMMIRLGLEEDVRFSAQLSPYEIAPTYCDTKLRA